MDNQNQPSTAAFAAAPNPSFPSINQLFKDSWHTFTQSLLQLFLLNIAGIAIYAGLAILAIVLFIILGAGSTLLQKGLPMAFANLFASPQALIVMSILGVIFMVIFIIIGSALQISSILIVDSQGKTSLGNNLKNSFRFIIPLFFAGILSFTLIFGSFFLFIIPAILIGFLLAFVQFEIILNNQKTLQAIKRSVSIISKHFGAVLIRLLLLFLIQIGFMIVTNILSNIDPSVAVLISIVSFIINLFWGWFTLAYTITLYKQARAGLETEPTKSITWMWLVAILGWIIAGVISFAGWQVISSGALNNLISKPSPTPVRNVIFDNQI